MSDDETSLPPDPGELRKIALRSNTTEQYGRRYWAIDHVNVYPKARELFELGATKRERLLKAANQSGKSFDAAIETAYHLTGRIRRGGEVTDSRSQSQRGSAQKPRSCCAT
jgi:hypothetical protein